MSWGAKPGTFFHSRDTWSNTVEEAEEHARFHAVDDRDPHDDFVDDDNHCVECGSADDRIDPDPDDPEEVHQVCGFCGAFYDKNGMFIEED